MTTACPICGEALPDTGICPRCSTQRLDGAAKQPTISGYRMLHPIGEGGMGKIYLAEDEALGRQVAVKLITAQVAEEAEALGRFRREARAMATVSHPHIVNVHAFGEVDGNAYIVMEYVEGENLAQRIRRAGALSVEEALRIARQVADALEAAWEKSIVHRDIKPSNILLDRRRRVRVADFGLAKPTAVGSDMSLTQKGFLLGTPHYMSPEQARGASLDFRSDVYSLGIVLYEMLAGNPPFEGTTPFSLVDKHLHEPLPKLAACRSDVPEAVQALIDRMTVKDPEARHASYAELLAELDALITPSGRVADAGERATPAALPPATPIPSPASRAPTFVPRSQIAWLQWAGGGLVVVMVAVLASVALVGKRAATPMAEGLPAPAAKRGALAPAAAPTPAAVPVPPAARAQSATVKGQGGSDEKTPAQTAAVPEIAVMSIQDNTGVADLEKAGIGRILSDAFVQVLNDCEGIRVLSPVRLDSTLKLMGRSFSDTGKDLELARAVCARTQANMLLLGSLSRLGQSFVLNATLTELPSEKLVGSFQAKAKSEDELLDRLTSDIATSLRKALEERYGQSIQGGRGVGSIATTSLDAYAHFVKGRDLHLEGDWQKAIDELGKALEIDPKLAVAWSELACSYSFGGDDSRAQAAAKRAEELSDRLTERDRLWVGCNKLWVEAQAKERVIDCYRQLLDRDPEDRDAAFYLGLAYRWQDHSCEKALPWYQKALDLAPTYYPVVKDIAECRAALGHKDVAVKALEDYLALVAQGHGHDQAQGQLAALRSSM